MTRDSSSSHAAFEGVQTSIRGFEAKTVSSGPELTKGVLVAADVGPAPAANSSNGLDLQLFSRCNGSLEFDETAERVTRRGLNPWVRCTK